MNIYADTPEDAAHILGLIEMEPDAGLFRVAFVGRTPVDFHRFDGAYRCWAGKYSAGDVSVPYSASLARLDFVCERPRSVPYDYVISLCGA